MINQAINGLKVQATAAATETLTVNSIPNWQWTGTTAGQIVQMPDVTTLSLGWVHEVFNDSTQSITYNSSGGNLIATVLAGQRAKFACVLLTGTTAASWAVDITPSAAQLATVAAQPGKNLLYNGSWRLDQINEGALYTAPGQALDGWTTGLSGTGVFKVRQLADPDFPTLKCLEVTCTTADASIAAGDHYEVYTTIEGYDTAELMAGTANAKQITISFDIKFSVTGVYGIQIVNGAVNRSYIAEVTQLVANARETKTVTLTMDTAGTWIGATNGVGLTLIICLAAGATYQGTANTWQAGNLLSTANQVNFMSNIANIGYIGQIQLEKGGVANAFDNADYSQILARGQRYYQKDPTGHSFVVVTSVTGVFPSLAFGVTMRAAPTVVLSPILGTGAIVTVGAYGFFQSSNNSTNAHCIWAANARLS